MSAIQTLKVNHAVQTPDKDNAVDIDISGKANKSEMKVVQGTGSDADKTTITLRNGVEATVLVALPQKWALADVTNSSGTAVTAADVGALGNSGEQTLDGGSLKVATKNKNGTRSFVDISASGIGFGDEMLLGGGSLKYRKNNIAYESANQNFTYTFPYKTGTVALTSDIPSGQNITNAATWAAGNAYEDAVAAANAYTDASISETNEDFVAAVQAASPPVELPKKWALANVTNANGGAVTAADVGAVKKYVTSIDGTVELLSSTNMMYGLNGEENESSPSMMFAYTSPYYHSYRYDNYYGTHYYEFDKSTSPNKMSYASISLGSLWNGFGVYCDDGYGNISSVSLPYNANGYFAIESWASLSRTLNNTATNATFKAACADALERISESKPHFAIIDGEVHIITVTP